MNVAERPNTLDDTIQEINPDMYPNMYTTVVMLLVMPASSATAECLSGLALMHVHKDKTLDVERNKKNIRLALTIRPNE